MQYDSLWSGGSVRHIVKSELYDVTYLFPEQKICERPEQDNRVYPAPVRWSVCHVHSIQPAGHWTQRGAIQRRSIIRSLVLSDSLETRVATSKQESRSLPWEGKIWDWKLEPPVKITTASSGQKKLHFSHTDAA